MNRRETSITNFVNPLDVFHFFSVNISPLYNNELNNYNTKNRVVTRYVFSSLIPFLYANFWSLIPKAWPLFVPDPTNIVQPDPLSPKKFWSRSMVCDPRSQGCDPRSHPSDPWSHPFDPWSHIPRYDPERRETSSTMSYKLSFLGHRSLVKNKTQTAVINIVNKRILINLTFRMLDNIHFQK